MVTVAQLRAFARESNMIEGIKDPARHRIHAEALETFVYSPGYLSINVVETFVSRIQPSAYLRTKPEDMVMIANHIPPKPSDMLPKFKYLLECVNKGLISAYNAHVQYEILHPFIDGNGRSGRALWLRMMILNGWDMRRGFLHEFYYQTLDNSRR